MPAARWLTAVLAVLFVVPVAGAQPLRLSASSPRVLFSVSDSVKTDRGVRERVTRTVTYDPVAGTTTDRTTGTDGHVFRESVRMSSVIAPTPDEAEAARMLTASHSDIAPLIAGARGTVRVEGGFPLVREDGHPCGPGGRCVLMDVFETTPGRPAERLRYVIVDLRTLRVLDADADPEADTNLAHPAARRQSRL